MLTSKNHSERFYTVYLKTIFDFTFSFLLLVFLSPVILLITIIALLDLSANPFFVQKRIGKGGIVFGLLKYRTYRREGDHSSISRFGFFLRSSSLDEVPQLFNILRGHMSFVGPRPLLPEYEHYYTSDERKRHEVKPGLTGLAQVKLGNSPDWGRRLQYDLEYLQQVSFFYDLKLILMTLMIPFRKGDRFNSNEQIERFDEYAKKR